MSTKNSKKLAVGAVVLLQSAYLICVEDQVNRQSK